MALPSILQLVSALSDQEQTLRNLAAQAAQLECDPLAVEEIQDALAAVRRSKLLIEPPPRRSKP